MQSVPNTCLYCSFRLILFSCSSMDPFHGVKSFTNGLLQYESPRKYRCCQKMCSYMDICPEAAPAQAVCGLQLSSGLVHLLYYGAAETYLLYHGPPWAAVRACITTAFTSGVWNSSFLSDIGICRSVSLSFSHSFLTDAKQFFFLPFILNTLPQRCHQHHW